MNCRVCGNAIERAFATGTLLSRPIDFFECMRCLYVQTETPYWLDEAYEESINRSDTGILERNLANVGLVLATLQLLGDKNGKVLDYAGGYGILVRLLRDAGVDALWSDTHTENLLAKGFEYKDESLTLLTAFEAFEHFVDPVKEMSNLVSLSPNILLTTTLIPKPTPKPQDWWYYGLEHGQHIGFFRVETLRYLSDRFRLYLYTDGVGTHFFSKKKYSKIRFFLFLKIFKRYNKIIRFGLKSKSWEDFLKVNK